MVGIVLTTHAFSQELHVIENQAVRILFDSPLRAAAEKVFAVYPETKATLERELGWDLDIRPTIILMKDQNRFYQMAPHSLAVAFADPGSHTIVINYTKMSLHPFSTGNTLKHELCHLLLHEHIPEHFLPRWLDEGVCQWSSDWIGDIVMNQKRSLLNKAAYRGRFIPLGALERAFPRNEDSLILAYEESRSFVDYTIKTFGGHGLLTVLDLMKNGQRVDAAFENAFSVSLNHLERDWHDSLRNKVNWLVFVSYYGYEIIFGLMALTSVYAFIRIIIKKRAYMAKEAE